MPKVAIGIVCEWPPQKCGQREKPIEIKTYVPEEDMTENDTLTKVEDSGLSEMARRLLPVFAEYDQLRRRKPKTAPARAATPAGANET